MSVRNRGENVTQNEIRLVPIGVLRTPFHTIQDMPIQPSGAKDAIGELILSQKFVPGLKDLDGFSHIVLIYFFHHVNKTQLTVIPFLDHETRGIFATRAPKRPNPIGLSIVRLISIENNILTLADVDMLDGTPVIDIKPFVPAFDQPDKVEIGWLSKRYKEVKTIRSDECFE